MKHNTLQSIRKSIVATIALAALFIVGLSACTDEREGQIDHISASDGALCFSLPPLDGFVEDGTRAVAVPGYEKGDRPWQAGDVVLAKMSLTETNAGGAEVKRYDIYTTLTVPTTAGTTTWTVDASTAVPVMYFEGGNFSAEKSNGDTGYGLLKTEIDGSISLVPPSGTVDNKLKISTNIYYHPNAKWEKVGNAYQPGSLGATPATIAQWKAEAVSNTTTYPLQQVALNSMVSTVTNFSSKAFKAMCHRVRVYTGKPYVKVKLTSTKFRGAMPSESGVAAAGSSSITYTAYSNAAGNAYFYGSADGELDGSGSDANKKDFDIVLPEVMIDDASTSTGTRIENISIYNAGTKAKVNLPLVNDNVKASARAIDAAWALSSDMVTTAMIDVSAADIDFDATKLKNKMAEYTGKGKYDLYIIGMDKAEIHIDGSKLEILYEAMNAHIKNLGNNVTLHLLDAPKVTGSAFQSCAKLGSIDMPEVTVIEDGSIVPGSPYKGAFMDCIALKSVNMPKLKTVGTNAFWNCTQLTSIDLPEATVIKGGTVYPEMGAFAKCASLKTANIPKVETLGISVFNACTNLVSIEMPKVIILGEAAFRDCKSLINVYLPEVTIVDGYTFLDCTALTSVNMPKVTTIKQGGQGAFQGCAALTSIKMPELKTIENGSTNYGNFSGCSALTNINLPQLETVGQGAFMYTSITRISKDDLPKVTRIGRNAFTWSEKLGSINLPEVTKIEDESFSICQQLTSIELPKVTSVGAASFTFCPLLTATFGAVVDKWGEKVFNNTPCANVTLTLRSGQKNFDINGNASGTVVAGSIQSFGGYTFKQIILK